MNLNINNARPIETAWEIISGAKPADYQGYFLENFQARYSYDEARKRFYGIRALLDECFSADQIAQPTDQNSIEAETLLKERIKWRDERNHQNELLRRQARYEREYELIQKAAQELAAAGRQIHFSQAKGNPKKVAFLQLSDWHYGLHIDNGVNYYSPTVCLERLNQLGAKAMAELEKEQPDCLYILLQGDLISSNIRSTIRLQNQEDIITQIIKSSEYAANLIEDFSELLDVFVVIVSDNHSRVTACKDDHLPSENYMRLTHWFLETRLSENGHVTILDNEFGLEIGSFQALDYQIAVVHGHEDKFHSLVKDLSTFTRKTFDIIFTAHNHHTAFEDIQKCRVVANASVCGTDEHSKSLRLNSYAGQNLSILTSEGELKLYPIILQ